jgi:hypothetical protein
VSALLCLLPLPPAAVFFDRTYNTSLNLSLPPTTASYLASMCVMAN